MTIRVFDTVTLIWYVLWAGIMIFCMVNAIRSVKKFEKKFWVSYVFELLTVLLNFAFMYGVDNGFVQYGENKFSGLNRMGDWLGFLILIFITGVVVVGTIICHVICFVKRKK